MEQTLNTYGQQKMEQTYGQVVFFSFAIFFYTSKSSWGAWSVRFKNTKKSLQSDQNSLS